MHFISLVSTFLLIFTLLSVQDGHAGFSDAGSVDGDSIADSFSSGYTASEGGFEENDNQSVISTNDLPQIGESSDAMALTSSSYFDVDHSNSDSFAQDVANDLQEFEGWIPIPYYDYIGRRSIIQLAHPEDRMYFLKRHEVYSGSPNNPHEILQQRTHIFGVSILNSNALFFGFGPGASFFHRNDKSYTAPVASYAEANQFVPNDIPKTFDEIMTWPAGSTMYFGSQNYGQLVFRAGAFWQGVDVRGLLKRGFTVKIKKLERKIRVSFITQRTLGGRAGLFSTPLAKMFLGAQRHKIYRYSFDFGIENPSNQLKDACTSLLSKHDLSTAFQQSEISDSGVIKWGETVERESEKLKRRLIGFPIIGRYSKSSHARHVKFSKIAEDRTHEFQQEIYEDRTKSRLVRKKKAGTSEPWIMHNHVRKEKQAQGFIDKQSNGLTQIGTKISYVYEYDQITAEDLTKRIHKLSQNLFSDELMVSFPAETPKGSAIIKLDIIFMQGSIYALRSLVRKDPELLLKKADDYLSNYLQTNETEFNPFYDAKTQQISKRWKKAHKKAMVHLEEIVSILKEFRPGTNRTELTDEQYQHQQIQMLGKIAHLIAQDKFVFLALQSLGIDLFKFHYEIKGETFSPYTINF